MIVVPAGEFIMGSPISENGRFEEEGPQHRVAIAHPFAVSRAPITRAQYDAFVRATYRDTASACASIDSGDWVSTSGLTWRNPGFEQGPDHPVVCISWDEAQAYAQWLSAKTGERYRLLSEAEFEYIARAGTTTAYPWGASGEDICAHANSFDLAAKRAHPDWPAADCDDGYTYTGPAEAFPANAFGIYGATGNVFQWTQDCWGEGGYSGAPSDGSARRTEGCNVRVIRGGSWLNSARGLRAAMRDLDRQQDRYTNLGFRAARAL
jgi:formylglycine-generating enzyme required for sulfatase activity